MKPIAVALMLTVIGLLGVSVHLPEQWGRARKAVFGLVAIGCLLIGQHVFKTHYGDDLPTIAGRKLCEATHLPYCEETKKLVDGTEFDAEQPKPIPTFVNEACRSVAPGTSVRVVPFQSLDANETEKLKLNFGCRDVLFLYGKNTRYRGERTNAIAYSDQDFRVIQRLVSALQQNHVQIAYLCRNAVTSSGSPLVVIGHYQQTGEGPFRQPRLLFWLRLKANQNLIALLRLLLVAAAGLSRRDRLRRSERAYSPFLPAKGSVLFSCSPMNDSKTDLQAQTLAPMRNSGSALLLMR